MLRLRQLLLISLFAISLTAKYAEARCASCTVNFVCEKIAETQACPNGTNCLVHDDDCGNWQALEKIIPPTKWRQVLRKGEVSTIPTEVCAPADIGPTPPTLTAQQLYEVAERNWLLTMALLNLQRISERGISHNGSFSFSLAESPAEQQAAMAGKEIAFPDARFVGTQLSGFNGYAEYHVSGDAGKISSPETKNLTVEIRLKRVNREKLIPVQGMMARLFYEKSNGMWKITSSKVRYVMPTYRKGEFQGLDEHPELLSTFLAKKKSP